jgi:hypothetical protein
VCSAQRDLGPFCQSVGDYFQTIEDQVAIALKWQLYQELRQDMQSGIKNVPERALFPNGKPENDLPESYQIYRRLQRTGRAWWAGGEADQPYLLMLELDACAAGEEKFKNELAPYLLKIDRQGRKDA